MATTSATGSSGLDVASIVNQLMTAEQRPLTALNRKEASYQAKLSAYGSVKGALAGFQTALSALSNISQFQSLSAATSDSSVATASTAATAVAGTYTLDVTKLAQAQKLVAAGQTSQTAAIGAGTSTTLTFDFGTITGTLDPATGKYSAVPATTFLSNGSGTKTVTIDATNNSLQGMRDAINSAKIGVTATIVNDGGASPYRLALSSDNIGKTNSIKISVAGDATVSGLLAYDPAATQNLSETATAQNAEFKVNGIAVSKASNTVTDVIQGVTLNLLKTTTTPASITVASNTSTVTASVTAFVKAYNDLNNTLKSVSAYNPATKTGAALQGDATVRNLQTQVRAVMNTAVSNAGGSLTTLSQVGVTFQSDGTLALDTAKLNTAITNNFSDIAALFAKVGKASDSLVTYISGTPPGSYAVHVDSLAAQGSKVGTTILGAITIAAGDKIDVTLDGTIATVSLTAGVGYTPAALAAMVQSAINGTSAFSSLGSSVAATIDGTGHMNITSNRYGSASNISMTDNGLTTFVADTGMGGAGTAGADVVGTIDGQAATGSGQFLTATGNAAGLKIQINGGAFGAGPAGDRGTVNASQGYAYNLSQLSTTLLASGGPLDSQTTGINSGIKDIGKQRDALNVRLANIQANYTKQFSALDMMLSGMNTTSNYLTQQLANLPRPY